MNDTYLETIKIKNSKNQNIDLSWLVEFQKKYKRSLKVLHVGNIANNAYLNSKILRKIGIEADVLCYDYYHMMATPEWEEVRLTKGHKDDLSPVFYKADLKSYKRPSWFIQGPLKLCASYFQIRESYQFLAKILYHIMQKSCGYGIKNNGYKLIGYLFFTNYLKEIMKLYTMRILSIFYSLSSLLKKYIKMRIVRNAKIISKYFQKNKNQDNNPKGISRILIEKFECFFPFRSDKLTENDIVCFQSSPEPWKSIFSNYDIVQCYSIDPIRAMLANFEPYIAFEHGTLRDFTQGDDPVHRLNSLAYRKANHVFITNGDCLEYAQKLGLDNYSAMIHPIETNKYKLTPDTEAITMKLRNQYAADILLFCPLRHDWKAKGTDLHLRALPMIRSCFSSKKVLLVLTNWGADLDGSKQLIIDLNCQDMVFWHEPMCRQIFVDHLHIADVVLDQLALPHFGATAPQALAAGVPVIMSYKPESTSWLVRKPAPIISAFTPQQIAEGIQKALDPTWRQQFKQQAQDWIDNEHSEERIVKEHLRVYKLALNKFKKA